MWIMVGLNIITTLPELEFDPKTGEPTKQTNQQLRFDPETGELLLNNNQLEGETHEDKT